MADSEPLDAFVMRGARAAAANGIPQIQEQIVALERAVVENPSLVFDLAKFIVESTCKTILKERNIGFDKNDNLPKLFKGVINNVPFLPTDATGESTARQKLVQTLNGLNTALQGICDLRSTYGFAAHGSAEPRAAMEAVQAVLAAQAADTIVGFLFSAHRVQRDGLLGKRPGRTLTIDKVLDVTFEPVTIAGEPYSVSEALWAVDREAYLAVAATIDESRNVVQELSARYPLCIRPELREVSFVHYAGVAYLKTLDDKEHLNLEDTSSIIGGKDDVFFPSSHSPDKNAEMLVQKFDPYSVINCFDLFTTDAAEKIVQAHEEGNLESLFPAQQVPGASA